jgi:outer membrane lipoprotein SlyB
MINLKSTISLFLTLSLAGCARDLSSNVYTSDSTLSLTLEGKIVDVREVKVKEADKLAGNATGALAGGALGAVAGSGVGRGSGNTSAIVGGAILGAVAGAVIEDKLGTSKGYEYIIKVDTSKLKHEYYEGSASMRQAISAATTNGLITVVQGTDVVLQRGQNVYVTFSNSRTRVIPAS